VVAHEAISRALFEVDLQALPSAAAEAMDVIVHSREWPILDVTVNHPRPIRFRFTCNNWNEQPPSIALLNPDGARFSGPLPGGVFNGANGGFVCMVGSREYHNHPSHANDHWANHRDKAGMTIVGIFMMLKDVWRKMT
jgi:Predicted metal binding domain